jgi:hypothetical protein
MAALCKEDKEDGSTAPLQLLHRLPTGEYFSGEGIISPLTASGIVQLWCVLANHVIVKKAPLRCQPFCDCLRGGSVSTDGTACFTAPGPFPALLPPTPKDPGEERLPRLVVACGAIIRLHDGMSGRVVRSLGEYGGCVWCLVGYVWGGRQRVVAGCQGGTAVVLDPEDGTLLRRLEGHADGVRGLVCFEPSFGPPRVAVAGVSNDRTAR